MLVQSVGKATNDVKDIVFAKDASIQDKSNKLGAYVIVSVILFQDISLMTFI